MDALDYLVKRVNEDSSLVNLGLNDNYAKWGELTFECTDENMIQVFHNCNEMVGIYGVEQALAVLQGHQDMFKG